MATRRYATQYDKMTRQPVSSLVLELGLPTTVSMLVTNIYNVADTAFVGRIGTSASGATGVVFGLMAILQAVGFMFGHGAGSNVSRQLGGKDVTRARRFAATSFYMSLLSGTLIGVLGLVFLTPLCRLLGSTPTILPYARTYATYILLAAPAMVVGCVINNILRYEGHAAFAMVGLVSGGVLNIFGDAVFIFGFDMGIAGAGLSTMLSQYISVAILLIPYLRRQTQTSFAPRYFPLLGGDGLQADAPGGGPGWPMLWDMLTNIIFTGMPSLVRQGLGSVSTMLLNGQAGVYGDAAVAAMSIVARITNFLFCVGLGIGQGFQPVSAFNYGAKKYSRVRGAFTFTIAVGMGLMFAFAAAGFVFAAPLVQFLRDDPKVIEIGVNALRAECVALTLFPVSVCANMLFQSIGLSGRATFLAALRSGACFIPVLLVMARVWGLWGVMLAQPVADVLSSAISVPFIIRFFHHLPHDGEEAIAV